MKNEEVNVPLSRRERQILDIVYCRGRVTVAEVRGDLPDAPGYSAVRALLAIMVEKGHLKVEVEGPRYVYRPARPKRKAAQSALDRVTEVFFGGSVEDVVAGLLDGNRGRLSDEDLERIQEMIERARERGR
jgi:predicted transcriptional regulator